MSVGMIVAADEVLGGLARVWRVADRVDLVVPAIRSNAAAPAGDRAVADGGHPRLIGAGELDRFDLANDLAKQRLASICASVRPTQPWTP